MGPLKSLKFKLPTPEAETLFIESFKDARARYGESLAAVGRQSLDLANVNFDLGQRSVHGDYKLADETYARLLDELARRKFAGAPQALRNDIAAFYAPATTALPESRSSRRIERIEKQLAEMQEAPR
jgi:hypothetical protein